MAQGKVVSGQVFYGPRRTPLVGAQVVLHRVHLQGGGGPIDSVRTGPRGRYTLRIARPDTTAIYVVSSLYGGIAYFSEPVLASGSRAAPLQPIVVYDTTSRGPPIRVDRRLLTVALSKRDGTRAALELLTLQNPGSATRVTNDTTRPTWSGLLPPGVVQFQTGQGDVSGDAVGLRGDTVVVLGPIPPREPKQVTYSYVLPATTERLVIPNDQPIGELDLLLEDTTTAVVAPGLDADGVQGIEGRRFASYRARALSPGASVILTFPRGGLRVQTLVPYVVVLLALVLGTGLVVALRKPPR